MAKLVAFVLSLHSSTPCQLLTFTLLIIIIDYRADINENFCELMFGVCACAVDEGSVL